MDGGGPGYDDDGADVGYKQDRDVVVDEDGDDGVGRMGGRVRKGGGGSLTLVPVIKGPLPPACVYSSLNIGKKICCLKMNQIPSEN